MTLTVKQIDSARFGIQKERMGDGGGLYLRLYPSGKKAFQVLVPREQGQAGRVWVSLGDYPDLGLRGARDLAGWVRLQASRGWSAEQIRSGVISENGALNLVKQFDADITGHGFRSSFKGWARAQRRYAHDAIEFALAHRLPPLEEAYLREDLLEERAVMMQDWADFLCGGVDLVELRARTASDHRADRTGLCAADRGVGHRASADQRRDQADPRDGRGSFAAG